MNKGLKFAAEWTLDKRGKYYLYGAFQCFLLDRFVPEWKRDFFQKKQNLDELTAGFLGLSPEEKKSITDRLRTRYSYDDLYARHDATMKENAKSKKGS